MMDLRSSKTPTTPSSTGIIKSNTIKNDTSVMLSPEELETVK